MPSGHSAHVLDLLRAYRQTTDTAERWTIVQAITSLVSPNIQAELNRLRRDIVETYAGEASPARIRAKRGKAPLKPTFVPKRFLRKLRWADYMITPEIDTHLAFVGRSIPKHVAKRLKAALTRQVSLINDLLTQKG